MIRRSANFRQMVNYTRIIQHPNAPASLEQQAAKLFVTVAKLDAFVESETTVKNFPGIQSGTVGDCPTSIRRVLRSRPQRAMRTYLAGTTPRQSLLKLSPTVKLSHA